MNLKILLHLCDTYNCDYFSHTIFCFLGTKLLKNGTTADHGQPWYIWPWSPRLTMVNHGTFDHGQQWYFWTCFWKMAPQLTMVNHDTFDHGQQWYFCPCFDHAFEKWDHGWPWSTMVRCTTMLWPCFWLWADHATDHDQILTTVKSVVFGSGAIFQKRGQPWFNHGQNPCLKQGSPWLNHAFFA